MKAIVVLTSMIVLGSFASAQTPESDNARVTRAVCSLTSQGPIDLQIELEFGGSQVFVAFNAHKYLLISHGACKDVHQGVGRSEWGLRNLGDSADTRSIFCPCAIVD